ncbi:TatD family hydrolase [Pedobacter sp. AW1-32]|uniref:TatD family hydrolase n=1 Tax=Pedobacter sp. AW1-32 TaxID=3383026 RepID=UPI003FF0B8B3
MQFLDIHTHRSEQENNVLAIRSFSLGHDFDVSKDGKSISIGLHPWYTDNLNVEENMRVLAELSKQDCIKMIGECGLDRLKGNPLPEQISILKKQILLAEELHKPVILHCVRAFSELIAIKKQLEPTVPLIIHGFTKNELLAQQLIDNGFHISLGAAVFKENSAAAKLVQQLDLFFLETDDSEISIKEIYIQTANLRNCTINELKALIFANWKKLKIIE